MPPISKRFRIALGGQGLFASILQDASPPGGLDSLFLTLSLTLALTFALTFSPAGVINQSLRSPRHSAVTHHSAELSGAILQDERQGPEPKL